MDDKQSVCESVVIPELYFLITKFLSAGPLKDTAKVLVHELENKKVLPKRIDWLGREHDQSFDELEQKYSHIGPNHLLEICCRIGTILDKELVPSVSGILSLLGSGRQNLLRTKDTVFKSRNLLDFHTRRHGMPIPDSANTKRNHNLELVLFGRETSGRIQRKLVIPTTFYSKTRLLRRTVGHLSAVYCVLFDRTGNYIITGADDLLVKLWSAIDGRLLATFRGASAEITDIAISLDNSLLAAGSLDRILRVWDLQTTAPVAVLSAHTGMITSVNFCPVQNAEINYLVTTSTDGSIAFWQYTAGRGMKAAFAPKPIQYHEKLRPGQAQMMCTSFSPGGVFLAAGSADHHVRVYIMSEDGPKRILETEAYTDAVDSIQWAHKGLRFISGSKDGTAHVWTFESQQWKSMKLTMSERLVTCPEPEEGKKLKVTMVAWDYSDTYVITAVNDFTIKIWEAKTGRLHRVLRGHKDELYVLESNPKDEFVLLSAGHDGQLFLWDIEQGVAVGHFLNIIDGQGNGGVFDAKWSPDGTMIAATDSHGHILIYGFDAGNDRFKKLPSELFFHTDYRPLLRDIQHMVLDEQTQMMPHLMPPPFLVDVDGNPHPPAFQRLVPGRESCPNEQLVPNIAVGPEGVEVVDNNSFSHLDRLIQALANRQGGDQAPDSNNDRNNQNNRLNNNNSPRFGAANAGRVGLRRNGDVEGVRQSVGNWQRESSYKWIRRTFVKPMSLSMLRNLRQTAFYEGQYELNLYKREMRRRPIMINTSKTNTAIPGSAGRSNNGRNARRGGRAAAAYRTRAVRGREDIEVAPEDEEEEEDSDNSDTSYSNVNEENLSESSSSDSDSSDYSDWVADKPGPNLEPPKRGRRRPLACPQSSESSDENGSHQQRQPGTSGTTRRREKPRLRFNVHESGDIPDEFKPPEWLSEVIPRKAPYYPQMGDEVVYFRQGHERYLETVRSKKVYKLTNSSEPWNSMELRDHELVRVIGIKYEIRPPRLCCMKLAIIERDGQMTGQSFTIKYHDMPDVLDFLVLRQTYDMAVERNWTPGDRFRCMIDDGWWMGQIEDRRPLSPNFSDSLFMCFRVRWDNGEYEYMSPWDMEPIDENRLPDEIGGAVPVLPEELRATLYQPKSEEWPRGDRDASCRRIIHGLSQVMSLAIADPFLVPVDLNIYPVYAYIVEYPIDLTTIKARFENHFYRRITSAQFDVRYLAKNAEKFNVENSNIVKHSRIITDLCLRIIGETNEVDVGPVYHQLVATYISSESENDPGDEPGPSTSSGAGPSRRTSGPSRRNNTSSRRSKRQRSVGDWLADCREVLEMLWQCEDSRPFREPVDTLEHPNYLQIVDTPMDLRTIKEDLLGGNYETPVEFSKDVRLIFQNSKNFNTNKRSRIYAMTLRLSTLFETHIKKVIYNWKSSRRRLNKSKKPTHPSDRNRPGPSTRAGTSNGIIHSSDDDDDDDDEDDSNRRSNNRGRNMARSAPSIAVPTGSRRLANGGSNRVSSSMQHASLPGPSSRNLRRNASRPNSQEDIHNNNSNSSSQGSSTESSHSDDDDDQGRSVAATELSRAARSKKLRLIKHRDDSEESYKPNDKRKPKRANKRKKAKDKRTKTRKMKRARSTYGEDSDDDDGDEGNDEHDENDENDEHDEHDGHDEHENDDNDENDDDNEIENGDEINVVDDHNDEEDDNESEDLENEDEVPRRRGGRRYKHKSEFSHTPNNYDDSSNHNDTPKKRRGRPPKTTSSSLRQNASTSGRRTPVDSPDRTRSGTRNVAERDHSYHLPMRNVRRAVIESDTEHELSRPTRSSARRALIDWARSDFEEEDTQQSHQSSSGPVTRKKRAESENSTGDSNAVPSTSSGRQTQQSLVRQVRTNRNTRVIPEIEEDNEDESDDEPLAVSQRNSAAISQRARNTRPTRVLENRRSQTESVLPAAPTPLVSFRRHQQRGQGDSVPIINRRTATSSVQSTHITRSHANNSDAVPSSSSGLNNRRSSGAAYLDHDYGEPGTSTARNTRRMLSRHQRNADELDPLGDPAEASARLLGGVSSRLRMRNGINSTTAPTIRTEERNAPTQPVRRQGRSRYSQENIEEQSTTNAENGEEDSGGTDEGTDGGSSSSSTSSSSDGTDSEDNQPLTSYVTPKKKSSKSSNSPWPLKRGKSKRPNSDDNDSNERGSRSTRNQKRPRYNEDTDESSDDAHRRPLKRQTNRQSISFDREQKQQHLRSNGNVQNNSQHTDELDEDSGDSNEPVSISSRGRVRKITAKARGFFRE